MFRLLSWLFGFGVFVALAGLLGVGAYLFIVSEDLPDYTSLTDYQPPVTTRVHAADGTLLAEFARERRLFQPVETIPAHVIAAFLSAEDKDFYSHFGIDVAGVIRAARDNIEGMLNGGSGLVGASTITQQVAKNFLLTSEQTWDRKIREALLALRIENTFSKDKILELYLNEIFLGLNSYGVAAAALNYFDKALYELSYSEAAYLAALPKGPANYHPFRRPQAAIERRNWVLDRMVENGYITSAQGEAFKAENLNVIPRRGGSQLYSAEYFTEEVRRQLGKLYGEAELYGGGLSVRTRSIRVCRAARRADGRADRFRSGADSRTGGDHRDGWRLGRGPSQISPRDVPEWQLAVVLEMENNLAHIGLRPPRRRRR